MENRKFAFKNLLFNEQTELWHDFDLLRNSQVAAIYPSNFLPLWCGAYDETVKNTSVPFKDRMVQILQNSGLVQIGGILTSLTPTNQQWDFPNAWSPLQSLIIDTLRNFNTENSLIYAFEIAANWVKSNYLGFQITGFMNEKYNALIPGQRGHGGEYPPQVGFGWTNGVVLDLLNYYGNVLQN